MPFEITPEEEFITQLEVYFDVKYDAYTKGRIMNYLLEYKGKIPVNTAQVIKQDKVVFRYIKPKDIMAVEQVDRITMNDVLKAVMDASGFRKLELIGSCRDSHLIVARHIAMYAMRELCNETWAKIASFFNRHHTTIIYAHYHVISMIEIQNQKYMDLMGMVNFRLSELKKKTA